MFQWNDHVDSFYEGLLIKVIVRCTYQGKSDDRCLMLKAQGTHHCKFHVSLQKNYCCWTLCILFNVIFYENISADHFKIMSLLDFHIFLAKCAPGDFLLGITCTYKSIQQALEWLCGDFWFQFFRTNTISKTLH